MQQANSPISIDFGVRDWCPILFTITKLWGINISCIREYTWKCCFFLEECFPFLFFGLAFKLKLLSQS